MTGARLPKRWKSGTLRFTELMEHLFAQNNADLLAQFALARVLVSFDFDGTLAPSVADRRSARMRAQTVRLFESVCERFPCVVLSGRSRADLLTRLSGARVERIVSNLGFEAGRADSSVKHAITRARGWLHAELGGVQGVEIEDRVSSLAVHYRRSRRKRETRELITRLGSQLPAEFRLLPGKLVVNVVHSRAPTKASAILRLRDELEADTVLYVGDDESDEEVFQLDQPGRLFAVRVGRSRSSHAAYYLRDQSEIDRLLRGLIALRSAPPRSASR